jgi:hypothetical protein
VRLVRDASFSSLYYSAYADIQGGCMRLQGGVSIWWWSLQRAVPSGSGCACRLHQALSWYADCYRPRSGNRGSSSRCSCFSHVPL